MTSLKIKYSDISYNEELKTLFHPSFYQEYINVNGCIMRKSYSIVAEEILDFEVRDDDIFVIGFPKSGTTWTQEMVWCIANDMDLEKSKQMPMLRKFPFLEANSTLTASVVQSLHEVAREFFTNPLEYIRNLKGQRFIKTHMNPNLIPRQLQSAQRKAKVVYVARDPRDVCISYYHFRRTYSGYTGDFSTFIRLFLDDKLPYTPYWQGVLGWCRKNLEGTDYTLPEFQVPYTPYWQGVLGWCRKNLEGTDYTLPEFQVPYTPYWQGVLGWCRKNLEGTDYTLPEFQVPYTPYWQGVLGYWSIRHEPNVLFIKYEEMKRDLPAVIERVATFLNKTLSPDQVAALVKHLSFDSMKNNSAVNLDEYVDLLKSMHGINDGAKFMRSGKSGVFLNDMSKEEMSLFDAWCRKNLEGTDYTLPEFQGTDKFKI